MGVDYETLAESNPRLIYCQLTAYGRNGPDSHRPGYDMILQAMTGMMAAENKTIDGVPQWVWSSPLIDTVSGFCMAWSICAALYARAHSGRGRKVETSLLASAVALLGSRFLQVESLDKEVRSKALEEIAAERAASAPFDELVALSPGSRRLPYHGNVYYRVYLTRDTPIGVGCLSDRLRRRLLDTLGLNDISVEPSYESSTPESQASALSLADIPQIEPPFLDTAPAGMLPTIISHSKGVKCVLIRSNSSLSWTNHRPAKRKISKPLVYDQVSSLGSPFALYDPVTVINPDAPKVD